MSIKIVSISRDGADPLYPVVAYRNRTGALVTVDTSTIVVQGNPSQRLARLQAAVQAALDDVTPLADLPADDPYVLSDPAQPWAFWDGKGNIVVRTTQVTLSVDATGHFQAQFDSLFNPPGGIVGG